MTAVPVNPDRSRVPTVGVEEELLLLDPIGNPSPVGPGVLAQLPERSRFHAEFLQCQVESVTGVCTDLGTLGHQLMDGRRAVATTAAAHGATMVSTGTPPGDAAEAMALTDDARYRRLRRKYPGAAREMVACGCHVHVGVPDRELGVQTLNRVRGWLPTLLALSSNSPWWHGRDSGWDSYRYALFRRWPSARTPPVFADATAYDAHVEERVASGNAIDPAGIYWFARLSATYPTVEFRIADAGLTVADTILQAALCRALVSAALTDVNRGRECPPVHEALLEQSFRTAARLGLRGFLLDPAAGVPVPGYVLVSRLVEHVHAALVTSGDRLTVTGLIRDRRRQRSGAARQRALGRRLDKRSLVTALGDVSLADAPTLVLEVPALLSSGG